MIARAVTAPRREKGEAIPFGPASPLAALAMVFAFIP